MKNFPKKLETYIYDELNFTDKMAKKLVIWSDLLLKWQSKINLISPKTIDEAWWRHFMDSLQLEAYLPKDSVGLTFADFGSGAGFPGLSIALQSDAKIMLIESDQRKAIFLSEVIRHWGETSRIKVINKRIETLGDIQFDLISARALADLSQLLVWSHPYLYKKSQCLFLKGKNWKNEILSAQKKWKFDYIYHNSITDKEAKIIILKNIEEKK